MYARFGDFRLKTVGMPPFWKIKKIVENRRFSENGWPKSKSNTGNGFLGVDYIYLDTSYVPIKVNLPGGRGEVPPLRGGLGKIFFLNRKIFWKTCLRTQKATSRLLNCGRAPPPIPVRVKWTIPFTSPCTFQWNLLLYVYN